jgi:hypothetical protein
MLSKPLKKLLPINKLIAIKKLETALFLLITRAIVLKKLKNLNMIQLSISMEWNQEKDLIETQLTCMTMVLKNS